MVADIKNGSEPILLKENGFKKLSDVVVDILDCSEKIQRYSEFGDNCDLLQQELNREIDRSAVEVTRELQLAVSQCIVRQMVEADSKQVDLYAKWREFAVEQRKLV